MTEEEMRRRRPVLKMFSRINVFVYRITNGMLMGRFSGYDVCLVTMTGKRSGKRLTIPLMYVPHQDGVLLVASMGGAPALSDSQPASDTASNTASQPTRLARRNAKRRDTLRRTQSPPN